MMYLSQLDCCSVLGIDPKTLRHWMRQAQLQFAPHPTDARLKCLTQAQVQQLAAQHARPLPWPTSAGLPQASPLVEHQATLTDMATLTQHLAHLQHSIITLQEQVTALVLEVARDRQRLGVLEALVQPLLASAPLPALVHPALVEEPATGSPPLSQRLLPAEVRARSRVTPLIEYGAEARYVLVCPREGALPFVPDSPEWFDWLATLISFRFVGPQGRFHAHRDTEHGRHTRSWRAYRTIHQHAYRYYLGTTDHLTLAALEQAAATLQSHGDER